MSTTEAGNADVYDFTARAYVPDLGAFASLDSVTGSAQNPLTLNRYLYALGNPATMVDPSGHCAKYYYSNGDNSDLCGGYTAPTTTTTTTATSDVPQGPPSPPSPRTIDFELDLKRFAGPYGDLEGQRFTGRFVLPPGQSAFLSARQIKALREGPDGEEKYSQYLLQNGPYALYMVKTHTKGSPEFSDWAYQKGIFETARDYLKGDWKCAQTCMRTSPEPYVNWDVSATSQYISAGASFVENTSDTSISINLGNPANFVANLTTAVWGLGQAYEGYKMAMPGDVSQGLADSLDGFVGLVEDTNITVTDNRAFKSAPVPNWNISVSYTGQISALGR
jgi:RHS repeat-associated protein